MLNKKMRLNMSKEKLTKEQWKDLMSHLLKIDELSKLNKIKTELLKIVTGDNDNEITSINAEMSKKDNVSEEADLERNDKERVAEQIFELVSTHAYAISESIICLIDNGPIIDLNESHEMDFVDSVKLVDMLFTQNLPSQVEAYYRVENNPEIKKSILDRKIILSDMQSSLSFDTNNKKWVVDGIVNNEQLSIAIDNLNVHFLSATSINKNDAELTMS